MAAVRQDLDGQVANSGQTKKFLHPILSEEAMVTLKLLTAGGIAGATAKSITAPLARLTILYQVQFDANLYTAPWILIVPFVAACVI